MSIFSAVAGAIGSSALDVVGSLISTKYANDLNMKNWHTQMDYNSPVNQLKRLREAGLNPNLIYGSGGVQNTITAAPKMDAPDGRLNLLANYQQILNSEKQRDLVDAQINNAFQQNKVLREEEKSKRIENKYRRYELEYLEKNGTIRGQNMVNGVLDRFTNFVLQPLGHLLGNSAGNVAGSLSQARDLSEAEEYYNNRRNIVGRRTIGDVHYLEYSNGVLLPDMQRVNEYGVKVWRPVR